MTTLVLSRRHLLAAGGTVLATGVSQVTVTELEVGAGGAEAVTTDVPVTADPKDLPLRGHEILAHRRDRPLRPCGHHQLVRVGAAVVPPTAQPL